MQWSNSFRGSPASGKYYGPWIPVDNSGSFLAAKVADQSGTVYIEGSTNGGATVAASANAVGAGRRVTALLPNPTPPFTHVRVRYTNGVVAESGPISVFVMSEDVAGEVSSVNGLTGDVVVNAMPADWVLNGTDEIDAGGNIIWLAADNGDVQVANSDSSVYGDFVASDTGAQITLHNTDGAGNGIRLRVLDTETLATMLQDAAQASTLLSLQAGAAATGKLLELLSDVGATLFAVGPTGSIGLNGAAPAAQSGAIADAAGGAVQDAECRAALNTLLAYLRLRGDIAV